MGDVRRWFGIEDEEDIAILMWVVAVMLIVGERVISCR